MDKNLILDIDRKKKMDTNNLRILRAKADLQNSINKIEDEMKEIEKNIEAITDKKDSISVANILMNINENEETFRYHKEINILKNRYKFLSDRKELHKSRMENLD